jgi:hypothetical protein
MARKPQKAATKRDTTEPEWTPSHLQERFLRCACKCGTVRAAARAAKIDEKSHRRWMKADESYAAAFAQARDIGIQEMEDEARKRAMKASDTLLIFMLKAARPSVYRERVDVDHSGTVGLKMYSQDAPVGRV